jgi:hypothetical protein
MDYNSPTVVADIVKALEQKDCFGAFSIGSGSAEICADIVARAKRARKFDAMANMPGQPEKFPSGVLGMASTIGSFVIAGAKFAVKSRLNGVKSNFVFGSALEENEVGPAVWKEFLGDALASGSYIASPEALVVRTKELEGLQEALVILRKGVSATKVVVSL